MTNKILPEHTELAFTDDGPTQAALDAWRAANPERVEPMLWPFSVEFGSDLEAALHWARAGFAVKPAGWKANVYLTDPAEIVAAWSGPHLRDEVLTRAPRGTIALVGDDSTAQDDFLGWGPALTWNPRPPHRWEEDFSAPATLPTFMVKSSFDWVLRLWLLPPGVDLPQHPAAHRVPRQQALSTRFGNAAWPLPSRSNTVTAWGALQPLPGHVARLLSAEPLPCERQAAGRRCHDCIPYNNATEDTK